VAFRHVNSARTTNSDGSIATISIRLMAKNRTKTIWIFL